MLEKLKLSEPQTPGDIALLQRLAYTEPLTGLFNRRALDRVLTDVKPGSILMFIDVDNLKMHNSTLGHQGADKVLKAIANILLACLKRSSDMAFRYGGDEFVVILDDCSIDYALDVANAISLSVCFIPANILCSVSIGIALHESDRKLEDALFAADEAVYLAKKAGKNCVVVR
jgi:diguanylate cyclase (GGDEF)-like protein